MKQRITGFLLFLLVVRIAGAASSQCSLPQPILQVHRANIFTEEQEQWLGDAQAEMIEPRYTLLPEGESAYLSAIGKRLLDQLPPTHVHYTFRVFESPDLRAFSVAGGHIYISRKLIMDARNEDELAAMLAQEIGRVYTHHSASAVTLRFDKLMHLKTLGDRADVYDKFERLLNVPPTDSSQLDAKDQQHDELLADKVGLYAMIRANYAPEAFATFLDRVNNNGGFTGNLFTDLFDTTPDVSIRVRVAHQTVSSLPVSCRQPRPAYRPGFKPFQDELGSKRIDPLIPATPPATPLSTAGLNSIPLDPPMSPALESVALSLDGKYALAQDQYQIHVLTTAPLKFRFSIDALGAEIAQFTPDSSGLVFHYNDQHIERWDLAAGKAASILDFVDYAGCVQTSLSPDGNVLACISFNDSSVWLKLVEVNTGHMLYQNMHFFDNYYGTQNSNFQALMRWTRDGRYFIAASGSVSMAYDLMHHHAAPLEKTLSNLSQERFAFVGSDKLVSTCDWEFKTGTSEDTFKMCYTTFPEGRTLGSFHLPRGWLAGVTAGDRLLFGPVKGAAAVIVDPATGKVHEEFKDETVDLSGDEVASELPAGGLAVGPLDGKMESVDLPATPLATLEASAFSIDGRYLAVSDRARGAEWDVTTGKRIASTSPFRAVAIDEQGKLQVQFIHQELKPSIDPAIDKRTHKYVNGLTRVGEPVQYGSIRIRFKPRNLELRVDQDVDLEAYDALSEVHLWTTRFDYNVPEIVQADGDHLLFVMDRQSQAANAEASRNRKKLIRTSDKARQLLGEEGTLVEVVSNRTGEVEHALVTPQLLSHRREERTASLFGDLVAVYGNSNDTTVYRVSDGARMLAFFGRALAGDEGLGMIAATNRPQELTVYDVANGKPLAKYILDHNVLAARFIPARKQLVVLTASQHVYRLDLTSMNRAAGDMPPHS